MPYTITWLEETVIIDFTGDVTTQEIREHGIEVNADPRFETVHKRISNCSKITSIDANKTDLKIFGFIDKNVSKYVPHAHMAVVSTHDTIRVNTEQYKDAFGSGNWKIQLFPTLTEALAWIPEEA